MTWHEVQDDSLYFREGKSEDFQATQGCKATVASKPGSPEVAESTMERFQQDCAQAGAWSQPIPPSVAAKEKEDIAAFIGAALSNGCGTPVQWDGGSARPCNWRPVSHSHCADPLACQVRHFLSITYSRLTSC
eukprot:3841891-Amphidinium_carterae.1